jgi:F0F1-type ATP synthase epsilon subunit
MKPTFQFKIDFIEGQNVEGQTPRVYIKDQLSVLTIGNQHAPIINYLKEGQVQIFGPDDVTVAHTFSFQEGFLTCKDNICNIHILK